MLNNLDKADYEEFQKNKNKMIGTDNKVKTIENEEEINKSFIQLFKFIAHQADLDGIHECYKLPSMSSVQYFNRALIILLREIKYRDTDSFAKKLENFVATVDEKNQNVKEIITSGINKYSHSKAKGLESSYRKHVQNKNIDKLNEIQTTFKTMMDFVDFLLINNENNNENKVAWTKYQELHKSVREAYKKIKFENLENDFFEKQQKDIRNVVYYEEHELWRSMLNHSDFVRYIALKIAKGNVSEDYINIKEKLLVPGAIWKKVFPQMTEITKLEDDKFFKFEDIKQFIPLEKIKEITSKRPQQQLEFERMIASWTKELTPETLLKDEDSLRIALNRISMLLMTMNSKKTNAHQGWNLANSNLSQKALQFAVTAFCKDLTHYTDEAQDRTLFSYNEKILMNYIQNLLTLINDNCEKAKEKDTVVACHIVDKKIIYSNKSSIDDSKKILDKLISKASNSQNDSDSVKDFTYEKDEYDGSFFDDLNKYISDNTCKELTVSESNKTIDKLKTEQDIHNYAIGLSYRLATLMKKKQFQKERGGSKTADFINSELEKIFSGEKFNYTMQELLKNKGEKKISSIVLMKLLILVPLLTKKIFLSDNNALKFDFNEINNNKELSEFQLKDVSHRVVNDDLINGILYNVCSNDEVLNQSDNNYNKLIESMEIRYLIERLNYKKATIKLPSINNLNIAS